MITANMLRNLLFYDPMTGEFRWVYTRGKSKGGTLAGSVMKDGYIEIKVCLERHKAHRLAWLWMTGSWPEHQVDHINLIRTDNRWANLRAATGSQNVANTRARRTNKSGFKGVSFCQQTGRWRAQLIANGKSINIGRFDTPEAAHAAYVAAAQEAFGQFARAS